LVLKGGIDEIITALQAGYPLLALHVAIIKTDKYREDISAGLIHYQAFSDWLKKLQLVYEQAGQLNAFSAKLQEVLNHSNVRNKKKLVELIRATFPITLLTPPITTSTIVSSPPPPTILSSTTPTAVTSTTSAQVSATIPTQL